MANYVPTRNVEIRRGCTLSPFTTYSASRVLAEPLLIAGLIVAPSQSDDEATSRRLLRLGGKQEHP